MDKLSAGSVTDAHPRRARVWTVSGVFVDTGGSHRCAGVAVAADLEVAAEQVCAYLPARPSEGGSYYLIASYTPLNLDTRVHVEGAANRIAAVHHDPGGVAYAGEWTVVEGASTGADGLADRMADR